VAYFFTTFAILIEWPWPALLPAAPAMMFEFALT